MNRHHLEAATADTAHPETALGPLAVPRLVHNDPWVADLSSESSAGECQSTIEFDNHPCESDSAHYVELEIQGYPVANPRWEGKLCQACLTGWQEWAIEEPDAIRVVSIHPIVMGD